MAAVPSAMVNMTSLAPDSVSAMLSSHAASAELSGSLATSDMPTATSEIASALGLPMRPRDPQGALRFVARPRRVTARGPERREHREEVPPLVFTRAPRLERRERLFHVPDGVIGPTDEHERGPAGNMRNEPTRRAWNSFGHRTLRKFDCGDEVSPVDRSLRRRAEHGTVCARIPLRHSRQGSHCPHAVVAAAIHRGLVAERDHDPDRELLVDDVVAVEGPGHRGPEVVEFGAAGDAERRSRRDRGAPAPVPQRARRSVRRAAAARCRLRRARRGVPVRTRAASRASGSGVAAGGVVEDDHRLGDEAGRARRGRPTPRCRRRSRPPPRR